MDQPTTIDLTNVTVIQDVAWMDERPHCRHLIASWQARRDLRTRCDGYGQREPGYCPINGGTCAMEDLYWRFEPGWDEYAHWCSQNHGYITTDIWPGFRPGMLGCYVVNGDCMSPTYNDADLVVARIGDEGFTTGAACIISRNMPHWGIPLRGKYLKRLARIGADHYLISADHPDFEPAIVPADTVRIVAVVLEGVCPEDVLDDLALCHVFDAHGRIVPNLRAVSRLMPDPQYPISNIQGDPNEP